MARRMWIAAALACAALVAACAPLAEREQPGAGAHSGVYVGVDGGR